MRAMWFYQITKRERKKEISSHTHFFLSSFYWNAARERDTILPYLPENTRKMHKNCTLQSEFMSIDQLYPEYFTPDMQYKFVDMHRCYDVCNKYLFLWCSFLILVVLHFTIAIQSNKSKLELHRWIEVCCGTGICSIRRWLAQGNMIGI